MWFMLGVVGTVISFQLGTNPLAVTAVSMGLYPFQQRKYPGAGVCQQGHKTGEEGAKDGQQDGREGRQECKVRPARVCEGQLV